MSDPFNWPFPSRKDLMALSSINKRDVGTGRPDKICGNDQNLKISDIEGSRPCMKPYQYTNKPDYVNRIDDIKGTRSKMLVREHARDGFSLQNRDINGAYPQVHKFVTTRAPTNPVDPVYKLPSAIPIEPEIPKFIRDNINIDDIPGTKPNPPEKRLRKHVHIFDEIDGSKSKPAFLPRDHMEIMDVKDINEYRVFKSSRVTNPLDPQYDLKDQQGQYGFVPGSNSRVLHPQRNFVTKNLDTQDIEGCNIGAISDHFLMKQKRTQYRKINDTKDVEGAQVGTLKKGFSHSRGTNPNNPQYQLPGRTEIYSDNKQYGNSQAILPRGMTPNEYARSQAIVVEKPKTAQNNNRTLSVQRLGSSEQGRSTAQKFDQFIKNH